MDAKEIWNYLVAEYEKNFSAQEDKIQTLWESYLANPFLFGYSDNDDIDSKRSLHIGSTDREIPDIILRSNHNDICIVELKRYSLPKNSDYEKQLLNYMTHTDLHLSIGVLVCKTLNIYHFDHAKNMSECLEIPFEKDSKNGEIFINLISKGNFSEEKIINFIKSENESKENVRNLKSEITTDLIKELIIKHFENKYSANDIEKVLSELSITISEKKMIAAVDPLADFVPTPAGAKAAVPLPIVKDEKKTVVLNGIIIPIYRSDIQSVQDFVKQTLNILFEKNLLSENEISLLQNAEYCKSTLSLSFPLLEKDKLKVFPDGHRRYWAKFKVGGFYVCNDWWKEKFNIYDIKIASWLVSLEKK